MSAESLGVVVLVVDEITRDVYVVPDRIEENGGKSEKLSWNRGQELVNVSSKRQFVGGVMNDEDGGDLKLAALREIVEETDIVAEPESVGPIGVSTMIFHKRPGDTGKNYGVEIYTWQVGEQTLENLIERGAVRIEDAMGDIRERDMIAYRLYLATLGLTIVNEVSSKEEVAYAQ